MARYILPELNSLVYFPSDVQIITPNKAIASSLKVAHRSLESLAQSIVRRQGKGIASALSSRRLLQNAVEEVFATLPAKNIEGMAKAYLSTVKSLFRSGIDLTCLGQTPDQRIQQLANLAIAYRQLLRKKNKIDSAEIYWQSQVDVCYQKAYIFYGYFAPGKDELALINAIAGENSRLVFSFSDLLPQNQQGLDWLQAQGWKLEQSLEPKQEPRGINHQLQECFRLGLKHTEVLPKEASLNIFASVKAEARGVMTQVKVLLAQGVKANEIVLITRDEQLYGETLIDIAWEYNLPLKLNYEIPLGQTRIGAWLKLLLEVIRDNFSFETTAKLLSHPLAKLMSVENWSEARQKYPCSLEAWLELGIDLNLLDLYQGSYPRQTWIKMLQDILTDWDVLEKAKFWAREIVAFYRLQEALTELEKSEVKELSKLSKWAFINEINDILALLTIPAQPGRGGVELHSPTSLLGTNYPYVFVLGSAEGILPTAIADDAILDFHSRKALNKMGIEIETAVDIAQKEAFNFYCLLGIPSKSIIFSYPELIDRNLGLPSPYLLRLGLKPSPPEILPFASIELARQAYLRQPKLKPQTSSSLSLPRLTKAWQIEAYREQVQEQILTKPGHNLDEYHGVIAIAIDAQSKTFSASQLTQIGQCPFKWFSARLLKLKELDEAEAFLSATLRGSLYHRCLELSLAEVKTAEDLEKFTQKQLAQVFAVVEQELNLTQLPGWEAQRQEHLNLLALNLTANEFLPTNREVIARETKFNTQWYGLKIRGQVDRVDRTTTGLMVIDYKTSGVVPAGVKDATGKASLDIQLAVYQDALAKSDEVIAEKYSDQTIDAATYYSITKQKTISRPPKDPQALAAFADQVKSYLQQGFYPVAPDIDLKACRYCDYDMVCRFSLSSGRSL